jgi:hypothetical protein
MAFAMLVAVDSQQQFSSSSLLSGARMGWVFPGTSEQANLFPARAGMMQRGTLGRLCSGMVVVEVSKLSESCKLFNFRKVGRVV